MKISNKIKWIYNRYIWWSDNEKRIWKNLLETISSKLWITFKELEEHIEQEQEEDITFKIGEWESKLMTQVIFKVTNKRDIYLDNDLTKVIVSTTKRRAEEIRKQFWFYNILYQREENKIREKYDKELELLMDTFIYKHKLFWTEQTDKTELTPEQLKRHKEISEMMSSLDNIDYEWSDRILDNQ